jgi:hypothetical protein
MQLGCRVFVGEVWYLAKESHHLDRARRPAANVLTGYRDIGQVNHSNLICGLCRGGLPSAAGVHFIERLGSELNWPTLESDPAVGRPSRSGCGVNVQVNMDRQS